MVNEAVSEQGLPEPKNFDIMKVIGSGQVEEKRRVY